jgi:DNA-directed RNA polymerase specialized sigma24 family protein
MCVLILPYQKIKKELTTMNISTITVADIIPEATKAISRYTKRKDTHITLFKYDTHITTDDLVMDTVEKVVKANPQYLTKTYVWLAAKSVCINRTQRKKLATVPSTPLFFEEGGVATPIEEELPGEIYDTISDLQEYLVEILSKQENRLLTELLKGRMYVEIAETLKISLRTLERRVQELKWKTEYLLTEEDPDVNPLVF